MPCETILLFRNSAMLSKTSLETSFWRLVLKKKSYLLTSFSPQLQVDERGRENEEWDMNLSEAQVSI